MRIMLLTTIGLVTLASFAALAPTAAATPPTCETSPDNHHNAMGYVDCVEQCLNGETFKLWPLPPMACA